MTDWSAKEVGAVIGGIIASLVGWYKLNIHNKLKHKSSHCVHDNLQVCDIFNKVDDKIDTVALNIDIKLDSIANDIDVLETRIINLSTAISTRRGDLK